MPSRLLSIQSPTTLCSSSWGSLYRWRLPSCSVNLRNKRLAKTYQSFLFLPYFLSWIVVKLPGIFSLQRGKRLYKQKHSRAAGHRKGEMVCRYCILAIYSDLLPDVEIYGAIMSLFYLAAISGMDYEHYEAAAIDGATRWQQIRHITVPMLQSLMIIMTLLAVGRIFNADFGLFYNVPRNSGALYDVTDVIDTYVFRTLRDTNNLGMAAAAGTYQAVVGCITVFFANYVVRRIDKDKALF